MGRGLWSARGSVGACLSVSVRVSTCVNVGVSAMAGDRLSIDSRPAAGDVGSLGLWSTSFGSRRVDCL